MGRLIFVGLGLGDERDLSARARAELGRCGRLFAELYTSVVAGGTLDRLSAELGRPVELLPRERVEAERPILEALDRGGDVGFLVAGDPFAATTHVALRLAAERAGHSWSYLPNASILTAAPSFLGLQQYRFGRTVSLPFPAPSFAPRSPLDGIAENRSRDLHTLVLLDLRPDEGRFMTANEGLRILVERSPANGDPPLSRGVELAVVARVGQDSAAGWYGPCDRLLDVEFGPPPHSIVVPGRTLHFEEQAALERRRLAAPGGRTSSG